MTSAAAAADFPRDDLGEVALVGRSNVGKSSLINALVRQRLARTSAAPGKTRLANIYRVARGGGRPLYLVDLPGYGYARGGSGSAREFEELTRAYFARHASACGHVEAAAMESRGETSASVRAGGGAPAQLKKHGALLLVDSRHPGLDSDLAAWAWLNGVVAPRAIVATKIDKLSRAERTRALKQLESVFEHSVLPCSAVTGEGLDELWKLIDRLVSSPQPQQRSNNPEATAPPRPLKRAPGPQTKAPRPQTK